MNLKWLLILPALLGLTCSDDAPVKHEPACAPYVPASPKDTTLTLLSFNMAIGFDAEQLITSNLTSPDTVLIKGQALYEQFLASRPRERIRALADSVARLSPDVIGLQEVLFLHNRHDSVTVDFLSLLLFHLDSLGASDYDTLHQIMNPLTIRTAVNSAALHDSVDIYFHEGNALLFKKGVLGLDNSDTLTFFLGLRNKPFLTSRLSILRGVQFARLLTQKGTFLDVYNTHLEIGGIPSLGLGQSQELLEFIHARSPGAPAIVVLGDLNDDPDGKRIDGFTADCFDFQGREPTCCYDILAPAVQAQSKLDYVLVKNVTALTRSEVRLSGLFRTDSVDCRLSDHAAVSAAVTFR